jgi:hypothetical protein
MSEGITDREMYRRAAGVVADLERRVKDGTASTAERARYRRGVDHMLIFDWATDRTPPVEAIPSEPPRLDHPQVARFCDWWSSNRWRMPYVITGWRLGFYHWLGDPGELSPKLWNAAEAAMEGEPEVTEDLPEWNRRMGARREAVA